MSAVESHRRWDRFRILFEGPIGALDLDKTWWVYGELDQLAGTLALSDPKFAQYLPRAYDYWFTHLVDKEFGEVWNNVDGRTHAPVRQALKQWEWKNAYHSLNTRSSAISSGSNLTISRSRSITRFPALKWQDQRCPISILA